MGGMARVGNVTCCRPLRFIVSCHRLSFEVGSLEPVFCRMYLADGATGERLSEDFHFHLNAKSVRICTLFFCA